MDPITEVATLALDFRSIREANIAGTPERYSLLVSKERRRVRGRGKEQANLSQVKPRGEHEFEVPLEQISMLESDSNYEADVEDAA